MKDGETILFFAIIAITVGLIAGVLIERAKSPGDCAWYGTYFSENTVVIDDRCMIETPEGIFVELPDGTYFDPTEG